VAVGGAATRAQESILLLGPKTRISGPCAAHIRGLRPCGHTRPSEGLGGPVAVDTAAAVASPEGSRRVADGHLHSSPSAGRGRQHRGQREPDKWPGATVRTLREVDPRDLLHPLPHALGAASRWVGRLAQQLPAATQGLRLVPVGEKAIMPDAYETARQHMQQEAPDKFVGVEPHGLDTMTLTTIAIGEADPPVTHVEDPVIRDGDTMRRAADIVQDVGRTCKGGLGIDDPLFGIELRAQLLEACRSAQRCRPFSAGQGASGACLGQRRTALPAKDGASGAYGEEEAGSSIDPVPAVSGQCPGRDDAVAMAMRS
jgi:hypothetical protein